MINEQLRSKYTPSLSFLQRLGACLLFLGAHSICWKLTWNKKLSLNINTYLKYALEKPVSIYPSGYLNVEDFVGWATNKNLRIFKIWII